MKFILLLAVVLGIAALQQGAEAELCFSTICGSNQVRGSDKCGKGHYGASRGSKTHNGVDIVCSRDSTVYSPFEAKVVREAKPYINDPAVYNTGLLLQGKGSWSDFKVWMFYFEKSLDDGDTVNGGDTLGTMLDMTSACSKSGMTNHIHLKLKKNGKVVNPEDYFC